MADPVAITAVREFLGILEMSARRSFTALGIGAFLLFVALNPWHPINLGAEFSVGLGIVVFALGFVNLLVIMGYEIGGKVTARRRALIDAAEAERQKKFITDEVQQNFRTLRGYEAEQLLWILRQGERRVDLPVEYSLISKHLLTQVKKHNFRLVMVHEWVWENRQTIIDSMPNVGRQRDFPVVGVL